MLVVINREIFNSLDDRSLIWTCIEPAIQKSRGKNFSIKSEAYSDLTQGQRALFMIQVLIGHITNGVTEFYSHLDYLLVKPEVWTQFKAGIRYFGGHDMIQLLEEMEKEYRTKKDPEKCSDLSFQLQRIDERLHEIIPSIIHLVGTYIRNNPEEFVELN